LEIVHKKYMGLRNGDRGNVGYKKITVNFIYTQKNLRNADIN